MKTFLFVILIATTSLFACKNSSKAMGSDTIEPSNSGKNQPKENIQGDVTYDMIISFISKGAGIDHKLKGKIDAILKSFNEKNNTNIKPEIIGWGREGEVDYHFTGKNLSTSQKKALRSQVKEAIGTSDMAHLTFNKKSVHKR